MKVSMWRRGFLLFMALLIVQLAYAASKAQTTLVEKGLWTKSDGTQVPFDCPNIQDYGEVALKLPKGCVAKSPGVWLSVERFQQLKARTSRLEALVESNHTLLKDTRKQIVHEQREFSAYLLSTENKLQSIADDLRGSNFSWTSAGIGLAIGASMCGGIAIGGAL